MTALTAKYKCNAAISMLAVVDVQQRLGEAMPGKVLNRVLQNAALIARAADMLGVPVIVTEQYPEGLGATHPLVAVSLPEGVHPVAKTTFSCLGNAEFRAAIDAREDRRQIVLVGMEAHICILQTALDLLAAGHEVFVVEDAICSRRLENYQNALDRMHRQGVNVVSAESVVFEWLGDSRHPHFKQIQSFLR
ncbi:MAG: hypothetical protein RL434_475 [Pseudomonadota bacterium]|jgi:nicotinamidase-related amidase